LIERDPVIRDGLARDLINVRALARFIQVNSSEAVSLESLVAAIRRYPVKRSLDKRTEMARLISKLEMKNEIVEVSIRNDPEMPGLLARFSGEVDYGRGDTLSIVSSSREVIVVVDSFNLDRLLEIVPRRNVVTVDRGLSMVVVHYNTPVVDKPGLLAAICNEIAIEGISIRDLIETLSESTFLVAENEGLRAYDAVKRLAKSK
jgi:hypothetical protein